MTSESCGDMARPLWGSACAQRGGAAQPSPRPHSITQLSFVSSWLLWLLDPAELPTEEGEAWDRVGCEATSLGCYLSDCVLPSVTE